MKSPGTQDDDLERAQRERRPCDHSRLVERYRALVVSVCRRYLREPEDVEDAVQETFLRLMRQADQIRESGGPTSLSAWLSATARSVSVDLIRRSIRERRRREAAGGIAKASADSAPQRELIARHLDVALRSLEEADRRRLIDRFFRRQPLRVLAGREGTSLATMSRRVSASVEALAAALRGMGVESADDLSLRELFGDARPADAAQDTSQPWDGDALRFAPDWTALLEWPRASGPGRPDREAGRSSASRAMSWPVRPGWTRPIRVGAMVSYLSLITPGYRGILSTTEAQVKSMSLVVHPGFQAVGIAESGTTDSGPIESALRDYELTGGLIDSADVEQLMTLDVILLGSNTAITRQTARALCEAVRGGVGLLNEFWTGTIYPGWSDPHIRALMLAASESYSYHDPAGCGTPRPATVHQPHPLLPGLGAGDSLMTYGCGPVYRIAEGAEMVISKDRVVDPGEHGISGLGPAKMPVFVVGHLGRGRAVVVNDMNQGGILNRLRVPKTEYLCRLVQWLAEPQRESA